MPSAHSSRSRACPVGTTRCVDADAEVLEHGVDELIDVFEDNVEMAMDFLAWVSGDTLNLIETTHGPGPELLAFLTA